MNASPYSYTGKVHEVGKLQEFPSGFAKRELVLVDDPDANWPNYAVFEFVRGKKFDGTKKLDRIAKGMTVSVKFNLSAFESKKNRGSWFSSARGVDLEVIGGEVNLTAATSSVPEPAKPEVAAPEQATLDEIADDMPF